MAILCNATACLNNAICVANNTLCECAYGFTGSYCETLLSCNVISLPCKNGGTCSPTAGTCNCFNAYTGNFCETFTGVNKNLNLIIPLSIAIPIFVIIVIIWTLWFYSFMISKKSPTQTHTSNNKNQNSTNEHTHTTTLPVTSSEQTQPNMLHNSSGDSRNTNFITINQIQIPRDTIRVDETNNIYLTSKKTAEKYFLLSAASVYKLNDDDETALNDNNTLNKTFTISNTSNNIDSNQQAHQNSLLKTTFFDDYNYIQNF